MDLQIAVRVSSGAVARISAELRDCLDGNESGGYLFALRGEDKLMWASGAGPNAARSKSALTIDREYVRTFELYLRAQWGEDVGLAGRWHFHPSGTVEMSDTDCEGAVAGLELIEFEHDGGAWLDLVLTSSTDYPEIHAYVTSRDPISRRITHEPAKFEEVD